LPLRKSFYPLASCKPKLFISPIHSRALAKPYERGEASGLVSLVGWPAYPRASIIPHAVRFSGATFGLSTIPSAGSAARTVSAT
jgi:hypothetical protein